MTDNRVGAATPRNFLKCLALSSVALGGAAAGLFVDPEARGTVSRFRRRGLRKTSRWPSSSDSRIWRLPRGGAEPSEAIIANWWRQGMAGGALAHYATVDSWLEDYTEDLKKITVPVLVMHGEADQVVPFASSVPRAVDLLKNGSLKTYPGYPMAC